MTPQIMALNAEGSREMFYLKIYSIYFTSGYVASNIKL